MCYIEPLTICECCEQTTSIEEIHEFPVGNHRAKYCEACFAAIFGDEDE